MAGGRHTKARVSLAPAKCHNILSFLHHSTGVLLCAKGFSPLLKVSLTSEMEIYGSKDGLSQPWPWKSLCNLQSSIYPSAALLAVFPVSEQFQVSPSSWSAFSAPKRINSECFEPVVQTQRSGHLCIQHISGVGAPPPLFFLRGWCRGCAPALLLLCAQAEPGREMQPRHSTSQQPPAGTLACQAE